MECPTLQNLLAAFTAAALEHIEAVNNLTDLVELGSKDKLANAKRQTEQTDCEMSSSARALEMHRAEHNVVQTKNRLTRLGLTSGASLSRKRA